MSLPAVLRHSRRVLIPGIEWVVRAGAYIHRHRDHLVCQSAAVGCFLLILIEWPL